MVKKEYFQEVVEEIMEEGDNLVFSVWYLEKTLLRSDVFLFYEHK